MTRPRDLAAAASASQRRAPRAGLGLLAAALLGVTGCGQQTPDATAGSSASRQDASEPPRVSRLRTGDEKPRLTCPSGIKALSIAELAPDARGAATPEKALAYRRLKAGERLVISRSGTEAWVLRADGTAKAQIGLMRLRGWVVSEKTSCG